MMNTDKMKEIHFDLGQKNISVKVPDSTDVLEMGKAAPIDNPKIGIHRALENPIGSLPLKEIVREKLRTNSEASAVIVISDNTRPVPYSGEEGILLPVVDEIIKAGVPASRIRILVAIGTHRKMHEEELRCLLDPRIFALRLPIINHDCQDRENLLSVGKIETGEEIFINRIYMESDIKILTGLVESHFMAGVSGGRKSICPGLAAEDSTSIFHGSTILSSPNSRDLKLEGNPVHERVLDVAKKAGCDMIVNVTIDSNFKLTGVFAGDLEKAHLAAAEKLCTYVTIPFHKHYDLVVTHTSFVGINHYQAAKSALVCEPVIKENGMSILAAHHTDSDPIGGPNYKEMMRLLEEKGTREFLRLILDPKWEFVPEQWQTQMWAKLFQKIPHENLLSCSGEIPKESFAWLPGTDTRKLAPKATNLQELVESSLKWAVENLRHRLGRNPEIAVLPDGPYGIPISHKQNK